MSAPAHPRWRKPSCRTGKAAYRSQGVALRALNKILAENAQAVAPLPFTPTRAYHCQCGAWHLTTQEQRTPKRSSGKGSKPTRRRVSQPKAARHLRVAPETVRAPAPEPAPVSEAPSLAPDAPITKARRELWRANTERDLRERAEARVNGPLFPRRDAA